MTAPADLTALVWMATTRHAEYHRPRTATAVVCGADMRHRVQMTRVMAEDALKAKPCRTCFGGAT